MATFTKFEKFVEALASKKHNLGSDQLKVALSNTLPNSATAGELADITEIVYTNLSARDLTTSSAGQTSGTYKLVLDDLVLTASGGAVAAFRYVIIYNDTAANDDLICFYDYGSTINMVDGEDLTLDFSASLGLLQLV